MGADLQNSYEEAENKLKAFKSYAEAKQGINKAIQKTQNQNQPNFDLSSFQLDQAEIERKIKKKVQGQFEKLIALVAANKGSGNGTGAFLIKKFVSTIKVLSKKLPDILIEEVIKSLGCDLEQTFIPQDIYIKTSSIDLFKILKMSPTTSPGKLLYEPQQINYSRKGLIILTNFYRNNMHKNIWDIQQIDYLISLGQKHIMEIPKDGLW